MFGIFSQVQGWIKIKGATDGAKIGNNADALKTSPQAALDLSSSFWPDPSDVVIDETRAQADFDGNTKTRGPVTTDEGSFRDDFNGTSLNTNLTGTVSFISGSTVLVGVGTLFKTELNSDKYIKATAQANTAWTRISYVIDDTNAVLEIGYLGATLAGTTAHKSNWIQDTATATLSVATSLLSIVSAAAPNTYAYVGRMGDYGPFRYSSFISISQRISNQNITAGSRNARVSPNSRAEFLFDGTVNTIGKAVTSNGTTASDIKTTTFTLPAGATTAAFNQYDVVIQSDKTLFYVNGAVVAEHFEHLPGPYDVLNTFIGLENTGGGGSGTTVNVDFSYLNNYDVLSIDRIEDPVRTAGEFNTVLPTYGSGAISKIQTDRKGRKIIAPENGRATYSAAVIGVVSAAVATDIFRISGSASKTVYIKRFGVSAVSTATGLINASLIKRSAANTGGTSAAATLVPNDSSDAAATASVLTYTANPTVGATVGNVRSFKLISSIVSGLIDPIQEFKFNDNGQKGITLRGVAEGLSLNLNGTTIAGGNFAFFVEWEEE